MRKLLKKEHYQEGAQGIVEVLAADTVEQAQDIVEQGFVVAHIEVLAQEAARIEAQVPAADTVVGAHIGVRAPAADTAVAEDIVAASAALVAGNTERVLQPVVAGRTVGRKAPVVAGALLPPPL